MCGVYPKKNLKISKLIDLARRFPYAPHSELMAQVGLGLSSWRRRDCDDPKRLHSALTALRGRGRGLSCGVGRSVIVLLSGWLPRGERVWAVPAGGPIPGEL